MPVFSDTATTPRLAGQFLSLGRRWRHMLIYTRGGELIYVPDIPQLFVTSALVLNMAVAPTSYYVVIGGHPWPSMFFLLSSMQSEQFPFPFLDHGGRLSPTALPAGRVSASMQRFVSGPHARRPQAMSHPSPPSPPTFFFLADAHVQYICQLSVMYITCCRRPSAGNVAIGHRLALCPSVPLTAKPAVP